MSGDEWSDPGVWPLTSRGDKRIVTGPGWSDPRAGARPVAVRAGPALPAPGPAAGPVRRIAPGTGRLLVSATREGAEQRHADQARRRREAISAALVAQGYLSYTRRRIPEPISQPRVT